MVGPMIDYPAKRFLMQGRKEGRISAVLDFARKGRITLEDAAEELDITPEKARALLAENQ